MTARPLDSFGTAGSVLGPRPTTLSARAMTALALGPRDPVTLMREVCRVDRLSRDAAERMARALLGHRPEFDELANGLWALRDGIALPPSDTAAPRQAIVETPSPSATSPALEPADPLAAGFRAARFAVVDVETTGTRAADGDRITEIAIVQVDQGEVRDVFSTLINPERPIPSYITALTGIHWHMVKDQPAFRLMAPAIAERLAGRVFTAHNAAFDWRFVREELGRCAVDLSGPTLCTVRLARALLPQLPRRSLDHVTRYFGIDIAARHRAAGDAEATAHVLLRLLGCAEEAGLTSWPALNAWLASPRARRGTRARRSAFPTAVHEDDVA